MRVCVCVRACLHACMPACVRACVCVLEREREGVYTLHIKNSLVLPCESFSQHCTHIYKTFSDFYYYDLRNISQSLYALQ